MTGRITTYPGQSKYQIVIETLEPAGVGALMALLEERKKKLAAEGLFDAARKQLLPFLPKVIGVITSPTGAVIRDILHRLADRFPRQVLVWPVKVQGEGSAEQVAAAINGFNAFPLGRIPRPDVIIVARGGGSLEDLWSFNEEIVVRAAAASMIPLISAVGHETDITLIDFVSDKRAPTPTAAAEMAVPVRADLITRISALAQPAGGLLAARHRKPPQGIALARARACPGARIYSHWRASGSIRLAERLPQALLVTTNRRHDRFVGLSARLGASLRANTQAHRTHIAHDRHRLAVLQKRASVALDNLLDRRDARLERAGQLLGRLLLSRRAGARLCAGARRRRPAAAQRGGDCTRAEARYRIQRRTRGRSGGRLAPDRTAARRSARRRADDRRSGAGQPVLGRELVNGSELNTMSALFGYRLIIACRRSCRLHGRDLPRYSRASREHCGGGRRNADLNSLAWSNVELDQLAIYDGHGRLSGRRLGIVS